MSISNLNIDSYIGKSAGNPIAATTWNGVFGAIKASVNQVIAAINSMQSDTVADDFYVNGTKTTPTSGVVTLASGGTYVLSGTLNGKVVIGASTETALTSDTHILLNGVKIVSSDATGIHYASESQTCYVTLAKNKVNAIVCTKEQTIAADQPACLFSAQNMVVQGAGYLAVSNKGGHGLRAADIRISGRPHIYIEATHDGVHGGNTILMDGGYVYIAKCNDGFGTGTTGHIYLYDGTVDVHGVGSSQYVFDSKDTTTLGKYFENVKIITDSTRIFNNMSLIVPSTDFATGSVTDGGTAVTPTVDENGTSVYNCTTDTIVITGYLPNSQVVLTKTKANVTLNKAYLTCASGAAIHYTTTSSKFTLKATKDTFNVVKQINGTTAYPAIQSNNNLEVSVKNNATVLVTSSMGNGIESSACTFLDMKGVLNVSNCGKHGIQASEYYIGGVSSKDGDVPLAGVVECYGNAESDIYLRLSGAGKKATMEITASTSTPAVNMFTGVLCCDTMSVETGSIDAGIIKGNYIKLGSTTQAFIGRLNGGIYTATEGFTHEPYDYVTTTDNVIIR